MASDHAAMAYFGFSHPLIVWDTDLDPNAEDIAAERLDAALDTNYSLSKAWAQLGLLRSDHPTPGMLVFAVL